MKTVGITCNNCGNQFEKAANEYARCVRLGRNSYCSRACAGKVASTANVKKAQLASTYRIDVHSANKRDEFTGFREFIRRARSRGNKLGNLSLAHIKDVWEEQKGSCVYSGVKLIFPNHLKRNNKTTVASLDRKDSSKLYEDGNVQFISASMNYMKGELTHEEMLNLCRTITAFWK